jgi:hypothetical protein
MGRIGIRQVCGEKSLVVKDYLQMNIDDNKPQSLGAVLPGLWLFGLVYLKGFVK